MTSLSRSVPRKIDILILNESSMMTLAGLIDPLRAANRLSRQPLYEWRLLSMEGGPVTLTCGIEIQAESAFSLDSSGDALIVCAGFQQERYAPASKLIVLRHAMQRYQTIFGVEAGSWVLARAGLITQHRVTTHWEDIDKFAEAFPLLDVCRDRYVIDQNIWTCGGASPAFDMMLHYLRTTQSPSIALDVASVFIYDESRGAEEAQPIVSLGRIEKRDPRLARAIQLMEDHLEDPLSMRDIAEQIGLTVRMLELLSRKYLEQSPGAYYLRLRLHQARRLVLDTNQSMQEIAVRCGFNSQVAFSRAFKRYYRVSPSILRRTH